MTIAPERIQKSTIVRAGNIQLRMLRAGFGALERLAPPLGGWWAARLWCTPPRSASAGRDDRPDLPGEVRQLITRQGWRLVVESWGPAATAPVYLVHGWGGWRGQLGAFVRPLLAAGHRVVAFDAPSHGESGPGALGRRRSTAAEPADALAAVVEAHGEPAGVVAHSLGGVATVLAMADGLDTPRLALVAPATEPFTRMAGFAATAGFGPRVERAMMARLERHVDRPVGDFAVANLLPRMSAAPPCLVVHDADDKETAFEEGRGLAMSWPGAQFLATNGLGHRRILRAPEVVAAVTRFFG